MRIKESKLLELIKNDETGLLWPHFDNIKAWSSSTLTEYLKSIEYKDKEIPIFVIQKAAKNGKIYHNSIQNFIEGKKEVELDENSISKTLRFKIDSSIEFIKKNNLIDKFIGKENLHYVVYEGELFASYVDLEFEDKIIELKTNNIKINESPISLLGFHIQLFIQNICSKKDVYLLWSTSEGIIFEKFQPDDRIKKIVFALVEITKNKDIYSDLQKRTIINKIIDYYKIDKKNILI